MDSGGARRHGPRLHDEFRHSPDPPAARPRAPGQGGASLDLLQRGRHRRGHQGAGARRAGAGGGRRWQPPRPVPVQPAFPDRRPAPQPRSRRGGRPRLLARKAGRGAGAARAAARRALLPPRPCRGRWPAGAGARPLWRRAGAAGQHRRHGAGHAGHPRGAARPAAAPRRGGAKRRLGARAGRAAAGGPAPGWRGCPRHRGGRRRRLLGGPAGRPEDRLVL